MSGWKLTQIICIFLVGVSSPLTHLNNMLNKKRPERRRRIACVLWPLWIATCLILTVATIKDFPQPLQIPEFGCYLNDIRFDITNTVVNGLPVPFTGSITIPTTNDTAYLSFTVRNETTIPAEDLFVYLSIPTNIMVSQSRGWKRFGQARDDGFAVKSLAFQIFGAAADLRQTYGYSTYLPLAIKHTNLAAMSVDFQLSVIAKNAPEYLAFGKMHFNPRLTQSQIGLVRQ